MKIMSVIGTRPEIIRLSLIIRLLDQYAQHVLIHTGQNYDDRLSALFFRELQVREPDVYMGVRGQGFASQVGQILARCEPLFLEHKPDRLLVLGDTNSGLSSLIARRLGIPVYHMEAGNRCYDDRVPEEVNRRVIDHTSSVLMPYTNRSKENLIREGIAGERIYVTGNPIKEVIDHFSTDILSSRTLEEQEIERGKYFLVTMHRAENVDIEERLKKIIEALEMLNKEFDYPIICSFHPRTRAKVKQFGIDIERKGMRFVEPLGFFDFINLEKSAFCILSDSGTVQEEACILGIPNITIRDVTERPETVECGSNILSGCDPKTILNLVKLVIARKSPWVPPAEYLNSGVSWTVARIMLGYRLPDPAEQEWRRR